MRTFDHRLNVEDIILCLGHYMNHRRPTGPGQAVLECDEETREKFRNLKSSDLKIRPDIAAIYAGMWDYRETWEANVGIGPKTRMPDEYRTVMLLRFDHYVLGKSLKNIKLNQAERWAWHQCKNDQYYWNETAWNMEGENYI